MSGAFSDAFSEAFDTSAVQVLVRLDFNLSVNDHERPRKPLWERYGYPNSQAGLLLYRDGTVKVVDQFLIEQVQLADDFVAGGHQTILDIGSWQAAVLTAAGYTLTLVPVPPSQGVQPRAYGAGVYGDGTYS